MVVLLFVLFKQYATIITVLRPQLTGVLVKLLGAMLKKVPHESMLIV
jgi:hypothetical protein